MECVNICPLASELSIINKNITCPEDGCGKVFQASSALNMHLTKHHRNSCLAKRDTSVTVRYFCPEEKCIYNINSSRFFSQMKFLKQHYLKVHSEKKHGCSSCSKAFATEDWLRNHQYSCGVKFTCSCGNTYGSYEALLTHSRRKLHKFDDKFKSCSKKIKSDFSEPTNKTGKSDGQLFVEQSQPIYILPKPSSEPGNILAAVALTELSGGCSTQAFDKALQTDPVDARRKKAGSPIKSSEKSSKRRASAQTQTGGLLRNRHPKKTAETQTIGDYILKKAMEDADILSKSKHISKAFPSRKRKKSMETQTVGRKAAKSPNLVPLSEDFDLSCDEFSSSKPMVHSPSGCAPTSFSVAKDVGLPDLWFAHKNTSSTQTNPVSAETFVSAPDVERQSVINADLNLEFFGQDGSPCASNNMRNLYFEENSDSLDNVVNGSSHFEKGCSSSSENINPLDTLTNDEVYSDGCRSCSIETQTEVDLNSAFFHQHSNNMDILSSTIETQTTEDLTDLDQLLYSNMCTQTCEDTLFSYFSDIETQTAWPCYSDELSESNVVSTETQTAISSCNGDSSFIAGSSKEWLNEASDIETQTNVDELKDLIEELDKPDMNKIL